MRKYQELEIFLRCPIIFRHRQTTGFSFECKSGWFELVFELSAKIEDIACHMKNAGTPVGELPSVIEVKQQFGTLRYHMLYSSKAIQQLIECSTQASQSICEFCGNNGVLKELNNRHYTVCEACLVKAKKPRPNI